MKKIRPKIDEDYFIENERSLKKRNFFEALQSDRFSFEEVSNFCRYQDEQTSYVTMHKTKGTGIENVLVVLDEYFWNEYDFGSIFDLNETNILKKQKNQRLIYVACSRAKKNLHCARLISLEEKDELVKVFKDFSITEITIN